MLFSFKEKRHRGRKWTSCRKYEEGKENGVEETNHFCLHNLKRRPSQVSSRGEGENGEEGETVREKNSAHDINSFQAICQCCRSEYKPAIVIQIKKIFCNREGLSAVINQTEGWWGLSTEHPGQSEVWSEKTVLFLSDSLVAPSLPGPLPCTLTHSGSEETRNERIWY